MKEVCFGALVLECSTLVSKSGNPYGILQFLDVDEAEVYRVFCFGDDSMAQLAVLRKGMQCSMDFWVRPDRNGGVRLDLAGVRNVQFNNNAEVV